MAIASSIPPSTACFFWNDLHEDLRAAPVVEQHLRARG